MDTTKKTEEKQVEKKEALPEAPASATVKIKSKNGFEYLFTLRDERASTLMYKIDAMEKKWMELGWTPLAQNAFKGQQKPIDYVPDRVCPKCQQRLVYAIKKDGERFIKCSTNKWDFATKTAQGCPFVEFKKKPEEYPERDYSYM